MTHPKPKMHAITFDLGASGGRENLTIRTDRNINEVEEIVEKVSLELKKVGDHLRSANRTKVALLACLNLAESYWDEHHKIEKKNKILKKKLSEVLKKLDNAS